MSWSWVGQKVHYVCNTLRPILARFEGVRYIHKFQLMTQASGPTDFVAEVWVFNRAVCEQNLRAKMRRFVLLGVCLAALQTAHSCSSFLLNETFGPGCLSGRTMDFETDLGSEIGYMPEGTELTLLPLCKGSPSPMLTTKHAFAFLTSARSILQAFHKVRLLQLSLELTKAEADVSEPVTCTPYSKRSCFVPCRTLGCRQKTFIRPSPTVLTIRGCR